ncbi:hypothetical protein Tco_1223549 [Tanacetum coccineum]
MGDENPICILGDYSKPSHEGYRNTIELSDPNQHLKDFLKLVDLLDLDGANRERMHLHLFQFFLRDQASNWLERLPTGSITTWEDLSTQSLFEAWTHFKDLLQKVPHHVIGLWLQVQIFYDHLNPITRRTIDQSVGSKLHDRNAEESSALLEDLALYDIESWNDPRDFAKPVKAIALPQDVSSTSDRRLIELKNQVQRLMEAHLAPTFNNHSNLEGLVSNFMASQDARLSKFKADFKQHQSKMTNKIDTVLKAIIDQIAGALPSDMVKNPKLSTSLVVSARSYPTIDPQ